MIVEPPINTRSTCVLPGSTSDAQRGAMEPPISRTMKPSDISGFLAFTYINRDWCNLKVNIFLQDFETATYWLTILRHSDQ